MTLSTHLFCSSTDGALFDTRMDGWQSHPIRPVYSMTYGAIDDTHKLRATLRAGAYAWPGGYPLYFVTSDGAALSFDAVRDNYALCAASIRDKNDDGWRVTCTAINWEDQDLICEHTGKPIESAY